MVSKYQKVPFPKDKLGKMSGLVVELPGGYLKTFDYQELELVFAHGQLCFLVENLGENIIMPIARVSTLKNIFENDMTGDI